MTGSQSRPTATSHPDRQTSRTRLIDQRGDTMYEAVYILLWLLAAAAVAGIIRDLAQEAREW
jgi:hypothetical protein